MQNAASTVSGGFAKALALGALVLAFCSLGTAQGPLPDAPQPSSASASFVSSPAIELLTPHRFWDKQNLALFTATAAINMADFAVTRTNLQSGGHELNPIVRVFGRSTPGLFLNFAGETAGVVGVSYFLHKTGHHRLERLVSTVDIGGSAVAVAYGLTHR
jgi:hypothetical protein